MNPENLAILKYPWHTGHDYELLKLPHRFYLLQNTFKDWSLSQRNFPKSATPLESLFALSPHEKLDLAILHLDQWSFHENSKRLLFEKIKADFSGPKIVINHGSNMVDGCSSEKMQELCEGCWVVCNSPTAWQRWKLPNSVYIRHGMDIEEWPETDYFLNNIVLTAPSAPRHLLNRNQLGIDRALKHFPIDWINKNPKFSSEKQYKNFLSHSSIYLNLSYGSAMPRSRTEAMLCGLAIVTTANHNESDFIENGRNGFASNDEDELIEFTRELKKDPSRIKKMGQAGRETARSYFSHQQFAQSWQLLLEKVTTFGGKTK